MSTPSRGTRLRLGAAVALALITGLGACTSAGDNGSESSASGSTEAGSSGDGIQADSSAAVSADEAEARADSAATAEGAAGSKPSGLLPALEGDAFTGRDVIRTASLSVVTDDLDAARASVRDLVDGLGGVIASETTSSTGRRSGAPAGSRTMRLGLQVPTERFDAAVSALDDLGQVRERDIRLEDATAEVADVESRVESAQTALDRIRALLGRANRLGTVIQLESVLAERQADLEALQAQQRALAGQTQLATLQLELLPPDTVPRPPDELRGFAAGIREGWDGLGELVVAASTVLGVVLPFALVGAVVLVPVLLLRRRRPPRAPLTPPAAT